MAGQNDTGWETAGQHPATNMVPTPAEADRSGVVVAGCAPCRFFSGEEAARDLANVLVRGPLLARAYAGGLDSQLRERVMVAVSRVNACWGCTRAHQRWAVHAGVSHAELDALSAGELERLDPRSRAAVCFAVERAERRFVGPVSPDVERFAREHLSGRELNRVDAVARAMALANLSLNTLAACKLPSRTRAT